MKPLTIVAVLAAFGALVVTSAPLHSSEMDEQIERNARSSYVFKTYLKGDAVKISSEDGVVTLTGSVSEEPRSVFAEETVASLRGEASSPAQRELTTEYAKDDDTSVTAQVKMSLLFHRATRVLKTHGETENGVVTLTGTAKSTAEKDLVSKVVEDVNGVVKVDNRMAVAK